MFFAKSVATTAPLLPWSSSMSVDAHFAKRSFTIDCVMWWIISNQFMYHSIDEHVRKISLLQCMQQYITFEVMEGAYDISCPDPDCPVQGVLNQHQMERLTDKELLDKHRTFR